MVKNIKNNNINDKLFANRKVRFVFVAFDFFTDKNRNKKLSKIVSISGVYEFPEQLTSKEALAFLSALYNGTQHSNLSEFQRMFNLCYEIEDYGFRNTQSFNPTSSSVISKSKPMSLIKNELLEDDTYSPLEGVTDLFIVSGNEKIFDKSSFAKYYLDWQERTISINKMKDIFSKLEGGFLTRLDEETEKE